VPATFCLVKKVLVKSTPSVKKDKREKKMNRVEKVIEVKTLQRSPLLPTY